MSTKLRLKSELLEGAQRFSIDFGGSVLKLAYLVKDPDDDSYTLIKCKSYTRAELQFALEFIKHEVDLVPQPSTPGGELPSMVMTGVGMYEFKSTIEKQLNIKAKTLWEGRSNKLALLFLLKHVKAEEQLFHPFAYTKDEEWYRSREQMKSFYISTGATLPEQVEPFVAREWPFLFVVIGSTVTHVMYREDGTAENLHFSPRGGRMFLGLGSLLTGAKTYDELIGLAKAGKDRHIHTYTSDLMKKLDADKKGVEKGEGYGDMLMDVNVFTYGWTPWKDISEFKREDLASAVLKDFIDMTVSDINHSCDVRQITNVVVCGGVVSDPFVRDLVEWSFHRRQASASSKDPGSAFAQASMRTLLMDSHIGAFGALLPAPVLPAY